MRDSGCAQVLIGFEAPVRPPLEGLERKSNWKARQLDKYRDAIDRIQSFGITVNGCFILGLDGMGPAQLERGLRDLARELYDADVTRERQHRFRERRRDIRRGASRTGTERNT